MTQFIKAGQYLINPDNVAYIEETKNSTGSKEILVYFIGSLKAPIHISGQYSVDLLKRLNSTTTEIDPGESNLELLRRLVKGNQEYSKEQEGSDL